ncbi:hypothetical protein HDU76_004889 [Blyttiomyces sp. JEL0837]|nr:hypothetical protein HDU76_004889 [Blyttiomyces sp. JEL0837]
MANVDQQSDREDILQKLYLRLFPYVSPRSRGVIKRVPIKSALALTFCDNTLEKEYWTVNNESSMNGQWFRILVGSPMAGIIMAVFFYVIAYPDRPWFKKQLGNNHYIMLYFHLPYGSPDRVNSLERGACMALYDLNNDISLLVRFNGASSTDTSGVKLCSAPPNDT